MRELPTFPISARLDDVRAALRVNAPLVIEAPPGTGKTTITPLALLDEQWLSGLRMVILQPRRMAVKSVCARMAELIGEPVGRTVGYRIRFESRVSAETRIEVVTEGLLTRRLQEDPALSGVGLLVFDEFHERSLNADLGLMLALEARQAMRPDLRLIVMSATLGDMPLDDFLPGARRIDLDARSHPVEVEHVDVSPSPDLVERAARETRRMLEEEPGDVLVFLPGAREINRVSERLAAGLPGDTIVHRLHGDLPYQEQARAILPDPHGRRKVTLSSPIAETSVTIQGVRTVVDSGLVKVPRFDTGSGLNRLVTERISQDAAEQRAGRAGRTQPGRCVRLWSKETHRAMRRSRSPEILHADLCYMLLELTLWGGARAVEQARWLTPPPESALAYARQTLSGIGALDRGGALTASGRELARLGCHPRLGAMLAASRRHGLERLASRIVALLEERDILRGDTRASSDVEERIEILSRFRSGSREERADRALCERALRNADAWLGRIRALGPADRRGREIPEEAGAGLLLAYAYPERVAQRRPGGSSQGERFLLAQGKGARMDRQDSLARSDYIVIADMSEGAGDGIVRLAAGLDPAFFEEELAHLVSESSETAWDEAAGAATSTRRRRCGAIVLSEQRLESPDPELLREALVSGLRARGGLAALPWDGAARELQARAMLVAAKRPELGVPALDDRSLEQSLEEWPELEGKTRASDWESLDMTALLRARLGRFARVVDEHAPPDIELPGGRRRRIGYAAGQEPVLEATVQELFGWKETPLLPGAVPLMLHILSPARRPIQVTRDLAGFWRTTYPEVRKELRGRYPKHRWPEDPLEEGLSRSSSPGHKPGKR